MTLGELVSEVELDAPLAPSLAGRAVKGLAFDSRRVEPDFLFFAFPGQKTDGRSFAGQAVERGAMAVVSECPAPEGFSAPWIVVRHGRRALALVSRRFYGKPDERLQLTGISGTNGKTTTVYLVDSILRAAGKVTGTLGTIEYRVANQTRPAVNTTPESLDLVRVLAEVSAAGGSHVTLEVSSHALSLGRVYGLRFHTAVFTNLTRDHLDFHHNMEDYFLAKHRLFEGAGGPAPAWAVINTDDEYGRRIRCAPATRVLTYSQSGPADLTAADVQASFGGLEFTVRFEGRDMRIRSPLTSLVNVENILAAIGAGLSYGIDEETICQGIEALQAVPGRFERVDQGQPFLVVVDYAHTDDALKNVIAGARALTSQRVITLFGCGGDRDRTKRPLMGSAAAEASDFVVLTSDNPRSEDPLAIMNDALVGIGRHDTPYLTEPDRETAIRKALAAAKAGDVVILAGKGHETYQILGDRTIDFDDREVARRVLREMGFEPDGGANH